MHKYYQFITKTIQYLVKIQNMENYLYISNPIPKKKSKHYLNIKYNHGKTYINIRVERKKKFWILEMQELPKVVPGRNKPTSSI